MFLRFLLIATLFFSKGFCHDLFWTQELYKSIDTENVNNVELSLKNGADVNSTKRGDGPLIIAVCRGNKDIVELLLNYGSNVNAFHKYGARALKSAINLDHIEIIDLLLKYDIDINAPDEDGQTYLMGDGNAAMSERHDILELLLKHGADVNAANKYGSTALSYATFYEQEDAIRLLLNYGANVNAAYFRGETALMIAAR